MMTGFSVLRSRLTGTLTTPGDTGYTAGVDAFNSTIWHRSMRAYGRPLRRSWWRPVGSRVEGRLNLRVGEDATATPTNLGTTSGT
jgi:hypothetical protein